MIKDKETAFVNILSNFLIIKMKNNQIFVINYLKKRKRIKLKFKKVKKKTLLITPTGFYNKFYFNFNKKFQLRKK